MVGSPVVAAFVAHAAFLTLLVWGWVSGRLGLKATAVVMCLWLVALIGLLRIPYVPFSSFVAMLDIALVFIVFKGDVRLT
jgi:hypothetical protein